MSTPITAYRQGSLRGRLQLRKKNQINPSLEDDYALPTNALISASLPGDPDNIVITLTDGEITIINDELSTIDYNFSPAKMALTKLNASAALDVFVEDEDGNIDVFEKLALFNIKDVENPLP